MKDKPFNNIIRELQIDDLAPTVNLTKLERPEIIIEKRPAKIDCPDLKYDAGLPYRVGVDFREHMVKMEEELIKKTLSTYLCRDVDIVDAKRCSLIYHARFDDRYILAYDNLQMGMMVREKFKITFYGGVDWFPGPAAYDYGYP